MANMLDNDVSLEHLGEEVLSLLFKECMHSYRPKSNWQVVSMRTTNSLILK